MYTFEIVGDIAWIARNLLNMEDFIFGPKLARRSNLDNGDFVVVDNNNNTPSIIESSEVKNVKLSKKKNCNKVSRYALIKLLNFITVKLPIDVLSQPLHVVNDKATENVFTSYASMSNDNGKAQAITVSSMIIFPKILLHACVSGSIGYSTIWRKNI
jgi:hypothetical protein